QDLRAALLGLGVRHGSSIGLRYIGITGSTRLSGRPQGQAEGAGGGGGEEAAEHGLSACAAAAGRRRRSGGGTGPRPRPPVPSWAPARPAMPAAIAARASG